MQHREFKKKAHLRTTGVRMITNDAQYVSSSTNKKLTNSISAHKDVSMMIKNRMDPFHIILTRDKVGQLVGKLYWGYQGPKRKGDSDVVVAYILKFGVSLKLRDVFKKTVFFASIRVNWTIIEDCVSSVFYKCIIS